MEISEFSDNRHNDLIYLTLKYGWFEPLGMAPRSADIAVCQRLSRDSKEATLEVCIAYMESHWRMPPEHSDHVRNEVWPKMVEAAMATREEDCNRTE
jgi:hypothetical protein